MTTSQIALNGSKTVTYLIHGLELTVEFSFQHAWFIVVGFNPPSPIPRHKRPFWFWKRLFWFGKVGTLKQTINKHYPFITFTVFSPLPKTYHIPLNIDSEEFNRVAFPKTRGLQFLSRLDEHPKHMRHQDLQLKDLSAQIIMNSSTRQLEPIKLHLTLHETKSI